MCIFDILISRRLSTKTIHIEESPRGLHMVMLFSMAMMWAPSFLFIKLGLRGFGPVTFGFLRLVIAGGVMYVIMKLRGLSFPRIPGIWKYIAGMAFTSSALPYVLFPLGEMYAESGAAAVMNGTTPIFTAILAHIFIAEERMSPIKLAGIFIGFAGIVLMFLPALLEADYDIKVAWGLAAFALAALCYGVSGVIAKKKLTALTPIVASTGQFVLAAVMLLPAAFLFERPFESPGGLVPVSGLLAIALIGTVAAYIIYYKLIATASATYVSFVTFVMPPFGLILGIIFLDEAPTWHSYFGCVLILTSVLIVNNLKAISRWRSRMRTPAKAVS